MKLEEFKLQVLNWFKWSLQVMISLILSLGEALLIYSILFILALVSFDEQDKNENYIPKSKRKKKWEWKCLQPLTKWTNDIVMTIESSITKLLKTSQHNRKLKTSRGIAHRYRERKKGRRWTAILAFAAVAMQANGMETNYQETMTMFDTDAVEIGVNNRCTGCISDRIEDFEGPMIDSNKSIKGFGGTRTTGVKKQLQPSIGNGPTTKE